MASDARREPARTLFAGAFANVSECCVFHPLDSVKTRFQLQRDANSVVGTLRDMVRHGGLREVYRGLLPAVGMQAPRGMIKFFTNETALGRFTRAGDKPQASAAIAAGFAAGATESLFITPFELVKVRLQSAANLATYRNTADAVRQIVRGEGIAALWLGLEATMLRNGSWNAAYFGGIHVLRSTGFTGSEPGRSALVSFCQGTLAGMLGSCFSNPIDVCKSRLQEQPRGSGARPGFLALAKMLRTVATREGIPALYRGFVPKLLRLGPGGGVLLLAFDTGSHLYDHVWQRTPT